MAKRLLSLGGLAIGFVLLAGVAQADEQSEFEKARNAYLARAYEEADARFRALVEPKTGTLKDRGLRAQARMFWGATLYAQNKKQEAQEVFEKLLLDDPQFEPDPLSFPTGVVNEFIDTRAKIRQMLKEAAQAAARRDEERREREAAEKERQARRIADLETMAREETVVIPHSRLVALTPFGVGQFQNGQSALGWFFLTTEAGLVAAGGITLPLYLDALQKASDLYAVRDFFRADQFLQRANTVRTVNLSLYGVFVATALVGVLHAQLAFVPKTRYSRPRTLPQATVAPLLWPLTGEGRLLGGAAGVMVSF